MTEGSAVPESEQGDLADHHVPADLLELHEAIEARDAGLLS